MNTEDYDAIGMIGKKSLPTGFNQMTASLTLSGPNPDLYNLLLNPFVNTPCVILGNVINATNMTAGSGTQFKAEFVARPTKVGLGGFESQKMTTFDRSLLIDKVTITMNGVEQLKYDRDAMIYSILGVDQWAGVRANLGE
jgi:P2 family phage contractile tail tube protein